MHVRTHMHTYTLMHAHAHSHTPKHTLPFNIDPVLVIKQDTIFSQLDAARRIVATLDGDPQSTNFEYEIRS